jgi:hypothetical protein
MGIVQGRLRMANAAHTLLFHVIKPNQTNLTSNLTLDVHPTILFSIFLPSFINGRRQLQVSKEWFGLVWFGLVGQHAKVPLRLRTQIVRHLGTPSLGPTIEKGLWLTFHMTRPNHSKKFGGVFYLEEGRWGSSYGRSGVISDFQVWYGLIGLQGKLPYSSYHPPLV